jgi:hypothetical protein
MSCSLLVCPLGLVSIYIVLLNSKLQLDQNEDDFRYILQALELIKLWTNFHKTTSQKYIIEQSFFFKWWRWRHQDQNPNIKDLMGQMLQILLYSQMIRLGVQVCFRSLRWLREVLGVLVRGVLDLCCMWPLQNILALQFDMRGFKSIVNLGVLVRLKIYICCHMPKVMGYQWGTRGSNQRWGIW